MGCTWEHVCLRPRNLRLKEFQPTEEKTAFLTCQSAACTSEFAYSGRSPTLSALKVGPVSKHSALHIFPSLALYCDCRIRPGGGPDNRQSESFWLEIPQDSRNNRFEAFETPVTKKHSRAGGMAFRCRPLGMCSLTEFILTCSRPDLA